MSAGPPRHRAALDELAVVLDRVDAGELDAALDAIAGARRIALHGVGREGLQIRGLAMRLHHLGLDATVVGEMRCPPIGAGDWLVVSAGPGHFSTVAALAGVARRDGAQVLLVTAEPAAAAALGADRLLVVPAQTMASDTVAAARRSVLPMGSLYEGALYVLFEMMVLRLAERLGTTPEAMRGRHTNLE